MLREHRLREIERLLSSNGRVAVSELTALFDVSEMTIRRDLNALEAKRKLERVHGGALRVRLNEGSSEAPVLERMNVNIEEKQLIAAAVAEMIGPNESIFIGSGTTTLFVARAIADRDGLTIVSNSLPVLNELAHNRGITVIAVGGFLRRNELSMIGHFAEAVIQELHVDRVFMGMRGIDPRYGLTSDHPQELITDRRIMSISEEIIVLGDSSKFGYVATSLTAPITAATTIITTQQTRTDIVEAIRREGVRVLQVGNDHRQEV
jgi:DeoR/GlpR family transcriptional regulator of sugar metabolism